MFFNREGCPSTAGGTTWDMSPDGHPPGLKWIKPGTGGWFRDPQPRILPTTRSTRNSKIGEAAYYVVSIASDLDKRCRMGVSDFVQGLHGKHVTGLEVDMSRFPSRHCSAKSEIPESTPESAHATNRLSQRRCIGPHAVTHLQLAGACLMTALAHPPGYPLA